MITAIKTPDEHKAALCRIDELMMAEADTAEAAELEVLAILVNRYGQDGTFRPML